MPLAVAAGEGQHRVDHFAHVDVAWPAAGPRRRDQQFNEFPLLIGEVAGVQLSRGRRFHAGTPLLTVEGRALVSIRPHLTARALSGQALTGDYKRVPRPTCLWPADDDQRDTQGRNGVVDTNADFVRHRCDSPVAAVIEVGHWEWRRPLGARSGNSLMTGHRNGSVPVRISHQPTGASDEQRAIAFGSVPCRPGAA